MTTRKSVKRSFTESQHATDDDSTTPKRVRHARVSASLKDANLAMLASGDYSDLVLKCDGVEIKVHKMILCSQSEFFHGCMASSWKESSSNEIELPEESLDDVKGMLQYLYSGDFPEQSKVPVDHLMEYVRMFALADKYGIPGLRILVEDKIQEYANGGLNIVVVMDALEFCSLQLSGVPGIEKVTDILLSCLPEVIPYIIDHGNDFEEMVERLKGHPQLLARLLEMICRKGLRKPSSSTRSRETWREGCRQPDSSYKVSFDEGEGEEYSLLEY
ncbi:POZ domain-containing protein [Ascobolus immersus RN42]|uniref:POZ domain-containing protein n=1 Tax=Ascobolus immersus RN42 TaxID=1160509 RepID=A0A3N4HL34_ASCIM|nr:POZ domain-containing protein [Ascobolus immersus RN42]